MNNPNETTEYREPPYASVWLRVAARVLDVGFILLLFLLIQRSPAKVLGLDPIALKFRNDPLFHWADLLLVLGYELIFLLFWGATPGKMLTRMQVVQTDDSPVRFPNALIRMLVLWIGPLAAVLLPAPILFMLVVVDFIMAFFSAESQMWHDVVARTVVKKSRDVPQETVSQYKNQGPRLLVLGIWLAVLILGTAYQQWVVNSRWQEEVSSSYKVYRCRLFLVARDDVSASIRVPNRWGPDENPDSTGRKEKRHLQFARDGLHFDMIRLPGDTNPRKAALEFTDAVSQDLIRQAVEKGNTERFSRSPTAVSWENPAPGITYRILQHRFIWSFDYYVRVDALPRRTGVYLLRTWGTDDVFEKYGPEAQAMVESFKGE